MTVIVCLSDGDGMTFNKRRQSRDGAVISDICELVGEGALFISDYSASLFSESDLSTVVVTEPAESASAGDFVFIEDRGICDWKDKIERLVIYRWNRKYPTDTRFDINPEKEGMALTESLEFQGKSHEKITREIWE